MSMTMKSDMSITVICHAMSLHCILVIRVWEHGTFHNYWITCITYRFTFCYQWITSIYSNKFFHIFTCPNPVLFVPGFRRVG